MATREENLKKINEELEKLSDEELEQVAGGSPSESFCDSAFFRFIGLGQAGDNKQRFKRFGIDYEDHWINGNEYIIDGQHYPREYALGRILEAIHYPGYDASRVYDCEYTRKFCMNNISPSTC